MNLLDKASIILTPTAYNNGEALCVKPSDGSGDFDFSRNSAATRVNAQGLVEDVQILSSNLVQNGDFSEQGAEEVSNGSFTNGETDWTFGTGWSVGEDKAVRLVAAPSTDLVQLNRTWNFTSTYKISFNVQATSGAVRIRLGQTNLNYVSQGTHTFYATPSGNQQLKVQADSNFTGSITDISVKEVDPNNYWTVINGIITDKYNASMTAYQSGIRITPFTKVGTFKVVFDLVVTSGSMKFDAGGGNDQIYSTSGTKEIIVTNTTKFEFNAFNLGWVGTLTNISVIEITDDTNLPRINYENFSYQDALGSELITNGDFSNGLANWVVDDGTSWTNVNDTAFCDGNNGLIRQDHTSTQSKVYKVTFDSVTNGGGLLGVRVASGAYAWNLYSTGTHTIYLTAGSSSTQGVMFYAINGWTGSIDNVSVKEYKGQQVVPDSGCGSWLFEPQSTNLITYSEDFSDSYWTKIGASVVSGFISPDGTSNAYKLVEDTSTGFHLFDAGLSTVANGVGCTMSVYAKASGSNLCLRETASAGVYATFDLVNGVVFEQNGVSANITAMNNDWYKLDFTFLSVSTFAKMQMILLDSSYSSGTPFVPYTGDGTSGVYLFGAQLEALSYSTSYIPTSGTSVTRNQDVCTNGGSVSTISSTSGVLYAEIAALANDLTVRYISISDGTTANRVYLRYDNVSNRIIGTVTVGGSSPASMITTSYNIVDLNKIAIKWKTNDFALWVNGVEVGTDTSGVSFSANVLTELSFSSGSGVQNFYGKTKTIAVFPFLTDTELQELTTI